MFKEKYLLTSYNFLKNYTKKAEQLEIQVKLSIKKCIFYRHKYKNIMKYENIFLNNIILLIFDFVEFFKKNYITKDIVLRLHNECPKSEPNYPNHIRYKYIFCK